MIRITMPKRARLLSMDKIPGKYISRYYAKKVAKDTDMIIKDGNGFRVVDAYEYKRNRAKRMGSENTPHFTFTSFYTLSPRA